MIAVGLKGYNLDFATTLKEADQKIQTGDYALMLLDLELPDGYGLDLLAQQKPKIPIIILTGKRQIDTKLNAFECGVDDYIEKPFSPAELTIRVDARIRKAENQKIERETKTVGDLQLLLSEQRLLFLPTNKDVDLTKNEFRLFSLLSEHVDEVLSRETLIRQIWDGTAISARTVDTHVANLRRKIKDSAVQIETVFGKGYRLKI